MQCLLALAPRPRLLILDEPFSGLDPVVRDDLTTGVLSLADRDGWSVLLTSHEMDDVERLADHVGFLANGALLVEEPMQTLLARFRRVEVALPDGAVVPDQRPPSWLGFAVDGRAARFVDSQASPAAEAAVARRLPGRHHRRAADVAARRVRRPHAFAGRSWSHAMTAPVALAPPSRSRG